MNSYASKFACLRVGTGDVSSIVTFLQAHQDQIARAMIPALFVLFAFGMACISFKGQPYRNARRGK